MNECEPRRRMRGTNLLEVRTINEIVMNKPVRRRPLICFRTTRYRKGDHVVFRFNNIMIEGRVTSVMDDNGIVSYHIETPAHAWYRNIDEGLIINKIPKITI